MGLLLMLIGYGWAALGVWLFFDDTNWGLVTSDVASEAEKMAAVSDLGPAVVLMMILPGLVVGALGQMLRRRGQQTR